MGRVAAAVVLGFMLVGCASETELLNRSLEEMSRLTKKPPNAIYVVDQPDTLSIEYPNAPELNRQVVVRQDGMVTLPILGDVEVGGMTPEEIAARLREEYGRYYREINPMVTVTEFNSKKVFVYGEIRGREGAHPYTGEQTVADLLGSLGGFDRVTAAPTKVRVIRGDPENPEIYKVDFIKLIREGDKTQDLFLAENDVVYVPPNAFGKAGHVLDIVLYPVGRITRLLTLGLFATRVADGG